MGSPARMRFPVIDMRIPKVAVHNESMARSKDFTDRPPEGYGNRKRLEFVEVREGIPHRQTDRGSEVTARITAR
jgi:hypothetical protein